MNELAIANPIKLTELKPSFAYEEVRQYPDCKYPFLRFQIGRKETRPIVEAIYEGHRFLCERTGRTRVSIFHLVGFGETLEAAQAMARRAK